MQKHKLPLIFFLLISFITFSGCENPSLPTETNNNQKENDYITVSFDINGKVRRTTQVLKDQTLKENQLPPENFTILSNWKFLYWSESKNSKKEAIEFDYSKPLTKDITLYAIFTPDLSDIQFVSSKLIEIKTYDDDIFVLNDGSIPGMKLLYSKDNINYEPIDLSIPNSIRKEKIVSSTYVYITYAFENRLTQGTHYFKVSNGLKETLPFTYEINESFENPKSVYFNNNGAIIKIIDLESGSKISSSDIPENPYVNSSNTFLYWSKSKSSQEEAIEFDFTSEITEDTTLYALYTPNLFSYSSLSKLSSSGIELDFYSGTLYPLDDGSFAGIHFLHSTNNTNWENFDSYITSIPQKKLNGIYTYNFISPLPKGNHYFKVTNGDTTTSSKNITIFEEPKTVTFISNDSTYKTITVSSGEKVPKPDNPSKYGNHFMYWAKSKASKNEAVSFDFKTPITENITLYAIYTPTLASNSIQSFNPNQIVIKLYEDNVFTFDDGSYAGLNFSLSTDKITYEALDFSIPSNYTDIDGHRYLTFLFTPQLPDTTQYVKVTNGHETGTSAYSPAKAVTNVNAETNDSFVKISFTSVLGWTSYTVTAYKNGKSIISKTLTSDTEPTDLQAEFYGLDNATEYTFKVITDSTDKFSEITVTPEIKQKESDWLVVMYLDGDNDLHEPIYLDMNEAEYGLRQIRKSDGTTAAEAYDSVNVVALWDGAVSWKEKNIKTGKEETVKPKIGKTGTYLFELGTDYSNSTTYTDSAGCVLSDETKNLSYTAGWIVSEKTVSTTPPTSYGEVNMGSEQTLENFLKWVKSHYTAKKGIILQFSDHGGGPRSARYVETPDGKIIKVGDLSGRRALCWDESSASSYLKTKDVSQALNAAGFSTNKASIILMDLCLGSSVEDAYQFKDYAEYYAASPNTIPALGLNYVYFMKSFKKDIETEELAKQILLDYKKQYSSDYDMWDSITQKYTGNTNATYNSLSTTDQEVIEWAGDLGITTFTITDLSKMNAVKDAIDSLCDILLSNTEKTIYVDANGRASPTVTTQTKNYVKYLGQRYANVANVFLKVPGYSIMDTMYYQGSYTWLYDIAYIVEGMEYDSRATISGQTNVNAWSELNIAAINVLAALNNAIKYSWRDSKKATALHNNDFYYRFDSVLSYNHYYGLTICGSNIATNGGNLAQGSAPDFYGTDLDFGKDTQWDDLLVYWFGK